MSSHSKQVGGEEGRGGCVGGFTGSRVGADVGMAGRPGGKGDVVEMEV
jgi:hypothetical protein